MSSVHITVGGVAYELEVTAFSRGGSWSHMDPPEPGEIELADEATFEGGEIKLEELIELIAKDRVVPLEIAAQILFDAAYEQEEKRRDDLLADVEEYERNRE